MKAQEQSRVCRPYHGAVSHGTKLVRAEIALAIMSVLGCLGGCSDSPSSVDGYEEYFVDGSSLSADQVNGAVHAHFEVEVSDSTGTLIEGAVVRFWVSSGTVTPETITSGLAGLATGEWTFEGIMGGPGPSVRLSSCASNFTTRCEMYSTIWVISLREP